MLNNILNKQMYYFNGMIFQVLKLVILFNKKNNG